MRDALQKNVSITLDFVHECELKFCVGELCKQIATLIDETVRQLPPESSPMNGKYIELKKEREETIQRIEDQLAERNERGSVSRPTDDDDLAVRLSSLRDERDRLPDVSAAFSTDTRGKIRHERR